MEASAVYEKLISTDLVNSVGNIKFTLGNREVIVESRDSVGNLIQNWFEDWLREYFPSAEKNQNTQEFPDFFLHPQNKKTGLLEVKTFDYDNGPGFDIANFDSYCKSLESKSYRLDSDYLIIAYQMNGADIQIREIWMKKVWEIAGPSGPYPLKVQEKKGVIYNIRPSTWYSERAQYKPFNNKMEFLKAIDETRYKYPITRFDNAHWMDRVLKNMQFHKISLV